MRICTRCRQKKPLTEFYKHTQGKRPDLISSACKYCEAKRMRKYYRKNKAKKAAWFKARYQRLKDAVFEAYGGYRCSCCGETEPMFLTIDHMNRDGSTHRRLIAKQKSIKSLKTDYRAMTGIATYYWLERNRFPPGFQVLCSNCNHGRHRNGGICPHQQHRSEGSTTRVKTRTAKRREVRSPS